MNKTDNKEMKCGADNRAEKLGGTNTKRRSSYLQTMM